MPINYTKVPSPCYVLDETLLRKNLSILAEVRDRAGIEIIPAFKGFALWPAFPVVREYFGGASASSIHEARLACEEMGCLAHTYSPAYTLQDFPSILKYSGHITFNSLTQFNTFFPALKTAGHKISPGLRINPEYSPVKTDLYNPCDLGSRLGITASQLPEKLPPEIEGLHFHTLCESSSYELEQTLDAIEHKFGSYLRQVNWINMGGGHLITRQGYDTEHLIRLLKTFRERWNIHIILEPGSAFAWETGVLVSQVVDIVENCGIKTALLNVSFAAHMPDCLEMPYQPRIRGAHSDPIEGMPTYRMGGNSCLAGDFTGSWSFDKPLKQGDHIIFEDMIHYTLVKTTMFNGVPHPAIALWNPTDGLRVVRTFGYDDYKMRMG